MRKKTFSHHPFIKKTTQSVKNIIKLPPKSSLQPKKNNIINKSTRSNFTGCFLYWMLSFCLDIKFLIDARFEWVGARFEWVGARFGAVGARLGFVSARFN